MVYSKELTVTPNKKSESRKVVSNKGDCSQSAAFEEFDGKLSGRKKVRPSPSASTDIILHVGYRQFAYTAFYLGVSGYRWWNGYEWQTFFILYL